MLNATYVIVGENGQVVADTENEKIEVYESLEATNVTVSALKESLPFLSFKPVKVTRVNYCAECHKDFEKHSIVHYAWIENNCFCNSCKDSLNIKDWELRYYIG